MNTRTTVTSGSTVARRSPTHRVTFARVPAVRVDQVLVAALHPVDPLLNCRRDGRRQLRRGLLSPPGMLSTRPGGARMRRHSSPLLHDPRWC